MEAMDWSPNFMHMSVKLLLFVFHTGIDEYREDLKSLKEEQEVRDGFFQLFITT